MDRFALMSLISIGCGFIMIAILEIIESIKTKISKKRLVIRCIVLLCYIALVTLMLLEYKSRFILDLQLNIVLES